MNNGGLHGFEITQVVNRMEHDGTRLINVTVKNVSTERRSFYAIYFAKTN